MNNDKFERLIGNEDKYSEAEIDKIYDFMRPTSILFEKMFKEELKDNPLSQSFLTNLEDHEKISQYLRIKIVLQLIFILNSKKVNLDQSASDHISSITSDPASEHTNFRIDQIGLTVTDPDLKEKFYELTRTSTLKSRIYPLFLKYFYN